MSEWVGDDRIVRFVVYDVIHSISSRWRMSLCEDDLVQAGRIGAWQAAKHYESGKKVPFGIYMRMYIKWFVYAELRKMDYLPKGVREEINKGGLKDVPFSGYSVDYNDVFYNQPLEDSDPLYSSYFNSEVLELLISCDTDKNNRSGILVSYLCGITVVDLSIMYGINRAKMKSMLEERKSLFLKYFYRRYG